MARHNLNIEVIFAPLLYSARQIKENYAVVVVDILRAGTTICTAFHKKVEKIIPVSTVHEAELLKGKGYLVAGERNGEKINFADFGNSPQELLSGDIAGKTLVITTTNGTKAFIMANGAEIVAIGTFTNLAFITEWLSALNLNILILCAGWMETFSLEDSIFAGALIDSLVHQKDKYNLHDSATVALDMWQPAKSGLIMYLKKGLHYQRLVKLGFQNDLNYAAALNSTRVIPVMENNFIKNILK